MDLQHANAALAAIAGHVRHVAGTTGQANAYATCEIAITDGTDIWLGYWRLSVGGVAILSSFDHGAGRGSEPIDADAALLRMLVGKAIIGVTIDPATGDLLVSASHGIELRGFCLRALFEDWEVRLPDGDSYWSNHVTR